MQHLVVRRFATSAGGAAPASLNRIHGGARHACDVGVERLLARPRPSVARRGGSGRPPARGRVRHVVIWITRPRPTANGNQPPVGIFGHVGGEERGVDQHERRQRRATAFGRRPPPPIPNDAVEEHRGDQHRRGDGDAVRRREGARRAETDDQPDASDHQQPVHERHVDLTDVLRRRVEDLEARQVVELHRLRR